MQFKEYINEKTTALHVYTFVNTFILSCLETLPWWVNIATEAPPLFYNRLMKYLNKHQIRVLYELKFGFLKKKTFNRTCTYICLIEKIISAIERNEFTVAAFLDLAKSIYDMNKYSFGMFCYKCHFGLLSDVFDNVFIKVSNFHRHHTRSQCNFHVRTSRVIYVDKSVKCRGTLLWNQLRDNVNNSPNFNIFKKQLVSFLRGSWMSVECCNCA